MAGPSNGTLTAFGSDSGFSCVANANFNGLDSFTYRAVDGGSGATAQALVTLTIDAIDDSSRWRWLTATRP